MNENRLAEKLLFSKEAAEYLGITVQRLNKLVQEGKVMPLKKNASGTVFYIDELDKRKEEQAIFTQVPVRGERGMFEIDTKEKQEALNYATLMNTLNFTEHKLEPLFEEFAKYVEVNLPISNPNVCEEYANFFNVESSTLIREYNNAKKLFLF